MLSDKEVKIKFDILSNKLNSRLFEEVISETIPLLKKRKHQVFYNILSVAYQSIGDYEKSLKIMEEAMQLNSNNPYFLNNLAITLHKLERFEDSEMYFLRGLEIAPNYINILNNLANLKKDLNYTEEAINYYKKSLEVNKEIVETNLNIAYCYQSLGNFDLSIEHLNKVLKLNPNFTVADRLISSMKKYENKDDIHLTEMLKKIKLYNFDNDQLSNLHFAIGKAYEDIGNFENSYENYAKGNEILKKISGFKIEHEKEYFNSLKKIFTQMNEIKKINNRKLIFIVGMPRSGTSLVEQILSSHKEVFGGGELSFLQNLLNKHLVKDIKDSKLEKSNEILNHIQHEYLEKIKPINDSEKVFTDKAPLNFRYIGFIKYLFPNSKIIHCKRDALEISWSNFKNYFSGSLPFTNSLSDIAEYYKLYADLMNFWKNHFVNDIFEIKYEDLVNKPNELIRELISYCELKWDDNCLKHENNSRSIKTASATQARKPIYKSALKPSNNFIKYLEKLKINLET